MIGQRFLVLSRSASALLAIAAVVAFAACGSSDEGVNARPPNTGAACTSPADCYGGLDGSKIAGTVTCVDKISGGYCSHTCNSDADCCAAPGECAANVRSVCSPFENDKQTQCFLSCEKDDLFPAGGGDGPVDEQEFCRREAGPSFVCTSSGGGHENRKICVPESCGAGGGCAADTDCGDGLSCNTGFAGGYCGAKTCASDHDCGHDSRCVTYTDGDNYCFKSCKDSSDCASCRSGDVGLNCSDNVVFLGGDKGKVCTP